LVYVGEKRNREYGTIIIVIINPEFNVHIEPLGYDGHPTPGAQRVRRSVWMTVHVKRKQSKKENDIVPGESFPFSYLLCLCGMAECEAMLKNIATFCADHGFNLVVSSHALFPRPN
jgi:hypothetical protein